VKREGKIPRRKSTSRGEERDRPRIIESAGSQASAAGVIRFLVRRKEGRRVKGRRNQRKEKEREK